MVFPRGPQSSRRQRSFVTASVVLPAVALAACVRYQTTEAGSPAARSGLACLDSASLGLSGEPAHSPQAARCIRRYLGIDGRRISPAAQANLSDRGFTCTADVATKGQTCTTLFSTNTTLSNSLGSGGSLRRQEVSVTVAFEGGTVTRMDFMRTVSTTFADPSQANRLVERSANLVGD